VKIEYLVLMGGASFTVPDVRVVDTISWDDLDAPTYDTGRVQPFVEALVAIHGAGRARDILAGGWSNGYTSTRSV
jgi:hypothetical protein